MVTDFILPIISLGMGVAMAKKMRERMAIFKKENNKCWGGTDNGTLMDSWNVKQSDSYRKQCGSSQKIKCWRGSCSLLLSS
jgi:hypothetical protein